MEPPVWEPMATGAIMSATAAAEPLDDTPDYASHRAGYAFPRGRGQANSVRSRLAEDHHASVAKQRHAVGIQAAHLSSIWRKSLCGRHI